ncbi:hypothetical protein E2C01_075729 [Portunus trituberculatus]|uniref:Uncharacterized protein n=1 Tax=Portunus trituberculatus TaxID=210409 RepID=A0A5B7IJX3_PORTR|nr:hypothetical protein [Portunus trituberculatus]
MRGSEPASPRTASTVVLSRELSAQQGLADRMGSVVVVVVAGFMFYVVGRGSADRRGERSIRITTSVDRRGEHKVEFRIILDIVLKLAAEK